MRSYPGLMRARVSVNTALTISGHDGADSNGEPLMATTQQGVLEDTQRVTIGEEQRRLTLPEATMFIVAASGALWVLLFGLISLFLG